MIQTSTEQINDQNHDHDHDPYFQNVKKMIK